MFRIHYFASVREHLGSVGESLQRPPEVLTVADLVEFLAQRGDSWTLLNDPSQILVAVDQAVASRSQPLTGDEEIAFFPPMTGG